jgi:hypothetical protein
MTHYKRFRNRWTINECLQLQREYELLKLSVNEIADLHQRTPNAIMFKLNQEGFADYNMLYSNYHNLNNKMTHKNVVDDGSSNSSEKECVEEEDEDEVEEEEEEDTNSDNNPQDNISLKEHVMCLEKKLNALTEMILQQSKGKKSFSLFG